MRVGVISFNTVCNIAVFSDKCLKYFCSINLDKNTLSKIYYKFKELEVSKIKIITMGDLVDESVIPKDGVSLGNFGFGNSLIKVSCISRPDIDSFIMLAESLGLNCKDIEVASMMNYYCNCKHSGEEFVICDYFGESLYRCYYIKDFRIYEDRIFNTSTCIDVLSKFLRSKTCPIYTCSFIDSYYSSKISGISNLNCFNYSNLGPIIYSISSNIGFFTLDSLTVSKKVKLELDNNKEEDMTLSDDSFIVDICEKSEESLLETSKSISIKDKKKKTEPVSPKSKKSLFEEDEDEDLDEEEHDVKLPKKRMKFSLGDDDDDSEITSKHNSKDKKSKLKVSPVTKKVKNMEVDEKANKLGKFFNFGILFIILLGGISIIAPKYLDKNILLCQNEYNVNNSKLNDLTKTLNLYSSNLDGNYDIRYVDLLNSNGKVVGLKSTNLTFNDGYRLETLFDNVSNANNYANELAKKYPSGNSKISDVFDENMGKLTSLVFLLEF